MLSMRVLKALSSHRNIHSAPRETGFRIPPLPRAEFGRLKLKINPDQIGLDRIKSQNWVFQTRICDPDLSKIGIWIW